MAEPISAAATAVATWVANAVFTALPGLSVTTAATIANVAYVVAYAATTAALNAVVVMGINALTQSMLPDPENGKVTKKQPRPFRYHLLGDYSRFSGAYMLREATGARMGVVLACAEGPAADISGVYLNDDLVVLDEDAANGWVQTGENGRYGGGDLIRIETRLGQPVESHYGFLTADFASVWPTTSRGDGIISLMMWCQHRSRESQGKLYPNGEPIPSMVGRAAVYDWRKDSSIGGDGAQRRTDPTTWAASANPIVWLVFIEWHRHGRNWERCIAPVLADLTSEADYCDEMIETSSGPQARYRCAGNYPVNLEPDAVRQGVLVTCDGWLSTDGRGRLVVKAGRYVEPVFTLTAEHIEGYTWRAFTPDESACNTITISYVSPEHDYTLIDAEPWRDEAAITAMGKERIENLQLNFVDRFAQARRLAKRKMIRLNPERSGQVIAGIHGLNGLGQRFIRIQNPDVPSMADVVVEVLDVEFDPSSSRVIFEVIKADPAIDDWDSEAEEGPPPEPSEPSDPGETYVEPPTEFTASVPVDFPVFNWRNPSTATFDHVIIRISATSDPDAGSDHSGPVPGAPGAEGSLDGAAPAAGDWFFWVVAVDIFGNRSAPVGPILLTIP